MLTISNLRKQFGDNEVLKGIDFEVGTGEVVALLGANGAGKSTLICCLSGAHTADSGSIVIDGRPHASFTPTTSHEAGIAVIYQHLSLIPNLDAIDNIFLGGETTRWGVIDRRAQRAEARSIMDRLAPSFPLTTPVGRLSMGQRQLVEIAKALRHRPSILVFDEPTAALGLTEVDALLEVVRTLAEDGLSIIYVTHLLEEVHAVAARVVVLRDGGAVVDSPVDSVTRAGLIESIAPGTGVRDQTRGTPLGDNLLTARGLAGPSIGPIDLELHAGEVLGVFGLMGSGRTELLETLAGARRATSGELTIRERKAKIASPTNAAAHGLYLVPSDRAADALFADLRCDENVLTPGLSRLGRLLRRPSRESAEFQSIANRLTITPPRADLAAGALSGGNQQKLIIARYLHSYADATVIMLDEPTQGVDVGARQDIYEHLRGFAQQKSGGILFTTSDPEEAALLADRCLVLHRGQVVANLDREHMTHDALLAAAHRSTPQEIS